MTLVNKTTPATVAVVILAAALAVVPDPRPASAAHPAVSIEYFQAGLGPYGTWHVSASFGRVWQPHAYASGWHPYHYGHWIYTEFGWSWVSDYPWGAIAYHYGTWVLDPVVGWVWVPGYVWAPAWVVFRTGPGYVGWAPVPPGFSIGVSSGFADHGVDHFVFVGHRHFTAAHVHRHAIGRSESRTIITNTTVVSNPSIENDVVVNRGIDVRSIERATGTRIEPRPIDRVPKAAPFDRVTRAGLSVDPERSRKGKVSAVEELRSDPDRRSPPTETDGGAPERGVEPMETPPAADRPRSPRQDPSAAGAGRDGRDRVAPPPRNAPDRSSGPGAGSDRPDRGAPPPHGGDGGRKGGGKNEKQGGEKKRGHDRSMRRDGDRVTWTLERVEGGTP